jgi:hypothetical protein
LSYPAVNTPFNDTDVAPVNVVVYPDSDPLPVAISTLDGATGTKPEAVNSPTFTVELSATAGAANST